MRFKHTPSKPKPAPCLGQFRTYKRFLLWPMVINGEWVWLERVTITEEYQEWAGDGDLYPGDGWAIVKIETSIDRKARP